MARMATNSSAKKPAARKKAVIPPAAEGKRAGIGAPKRRKTDWQAVERDYRTGSFTLRELEAKHGANNGTISRRAAKLGWTQDLSNAVKHATNSALIESVLAEKSSNAQQSTAVAVLAAAEVNKTVILGHRQDIRYTRDVAVSLLDELAASRMLAEEQELLVEILAGEGAEHVDVSRARSVVRKALDLPSRVSSIKALAETFSKLQAMERDAFGLKNDEKDPSDSPRKRVTVDFVDVVAR